LAAPAPILSLRDHAIARMRLSCIGGVCRVDS